MISISNGLKSMRNRSKKGNIGEYAPLSLNSDFPITAPRFVKPPPLPHIHDCFEIGYCVTGGGVFLIEKKIFTCSPGDAVFINSHEFHLLRNATPEDSHWKFINLDPEKLLIGHVLTEETILDLSRLSGPEFQNVVTQASHPDITGLVKELINELELRSRGYHDCVRGIVWTFLIKLMRLAPAHATHPRNNDSVKRIAPALQHIVRNYKNSFSIDKLAELCYCSTSNFRKIFTRTMKCSPKEYLIRYRLVAACAMLKNSDRQIIDIASEAGFKTLSNFNRSFKNALGASPRKYRKGECLFK